MAFGDYAHCDECVAEWEKILVRIRAGETTMDEHEKPIGYKAHYMGEDDLAEGLTLICDRHLNAKKDRITQLEELLRRAHAAWTGTGPAIDLETMEKELGEAINKATQTKEGG